MFAALSAPPNREHSARHTQRINSMIASTSNKAIDAATYGFHVATQVKKTASPSSPRLSAMLLKGSGEGVTAARAAVFPPWAASAISPPAIVATICSPGESELVA